MFGALAKTYYATKKGLKAQRCLCGFDHALYCQDKKYEANARKCVPVAIRMFDYVLTTREVGDDD
jgi:iron only hydrogenase large subunit-like protein